jgi:hypothetical protein
MQFTLYMNIKEDITHPQPVAVAEQSEAWTVFDRSETVMVGSSPVLGMDV